MARITVEDCLEQVENRFHLVRVASKRARQIMNGKEPTLNWDNDKATVLALREIAAGNITEEMLDEKPVVNDDEAVFDQSEIDEEIGNLLSEGEGNSEGDNPLNASSEEESLAPDSLEENSADADREEPEEESI
tara:strand:- start:710 stop:1111 length:402 start_codon:yes stop_codon:yes gene_type:complete